MWLRKSLLPSATPPPGSPSCLGKSARSRLADGAWKAESERWVGVGGLLGSRFTPDCPSSQEETPPTGLNSWVCADLGAAGLGRDRPGWGLPRAPSPGGVSAGGQAVGARALRRVSARELRDCPQRASDFTHAPGALLCSEPAALCVYVCGHAPRRAICRRRVLSRGDRWGVSRSTGDRA